MCSSACSRPGRRRCIDFEDCRFVFLLDPRATGHRRRGRRCLSRRRNLDSPGRRSSPHKNWRLRRSFLNVRNAVADFFDHADALWGATSKQSQNSGDLRRESHRARSCPITQSLFQSRLKLNVHPRERFRYRTIRLRPRREILERRRIDPRHFSRRFEINSIDRESRFQLV